MPWEALIALILPLLKSILEKEKAAVKAGVEGPATAYFKAADEGQSPQDCLKAAAASYVRCCDLPPA